LWTNGFSGVTYVPAEEIERFLHHPQYAVTGERLDAADGLPGLPSDRFPEPSLVESPGGRILNRVPALVDSLFGSSDRAIERLAGFFWTAR
jgi:hypothetical protein